MHVVAYDWVKNLSVSHARQTRATISEESKKGDIEFCLK